MYPGSWNIESVDDEYKDSLKKWLRSKTRKELEGIRNGAVIHLQCVDEIYREKSI